MSAGYHVAILQGGNSREAHISRVSAAGVAHALRAGGHEVTLIELDRTAAGQLDRLRPDAVFPALHGPPGEDGTVQGLLEMLELPYVGSGVRGSALAMDKPVAKAIFRRAGLPVADDFLVPRSMPTEAAAARIRTAFGSRVVIKPASLGSAIGVVRLADGGDLEQSLDATLAFGDALTEPFVSGREMTGGVLDLHGQAAHAFPVIEIRTAPGEWYDAVNRYKADGSEHLIPARLPEPVAQKLQNIAVAAHEGLGLRDLSRADFIVGDDDEITLLEVNSMPGMTPTSLYPDGARATGMEFPALVAALVKSAVQRGAEVMGSE